MVSTYRGGEYTSLKSILDIIQEELKKREEVRENLQRNMRMTTRLSKKAILFMHQHRFDDARKLLEEASELLIKLREVSKDYPDLIYAGIVSAAFQEYVEAHTLLKLILENRFIGPEELGVPAVSYVLGLADVIGEFRRRSLDSLRKGNVELAEDCLQKMEYIYMELMTMDDAYLLVPGLRRKCDVARRIIEATRGDVTIEIRRSSLERSIKDLEKVVERKRNIR